MGGVGLSLLIENALTDPHLGEWLQRVHASVPHAEIVSCSGGAMRDEFTFADRDEAAGEIRIRRD